MSDGSRETDRRTRLTPPEPARLLRAGSRADLALRRTWRLELAPRDVEVAVRMLGDMPLRRSIDSLQRIAAVDAELQTIRRFLSGFQGRVEEHELPLGSHREMALLDAVLDDVGELIRMLEARCGPFPDLQLGGDDSGVRATFLVEIDKGRLDDCRWLLQRALEASDAPPPDELLGRAYLRAVGQDLEDLGAYLEELASEQGEGELRDVVVQVQQGCRAMAEKVASALSPPR